MAEIMFEEFQVPAFYIANTGVLNAYVAFLLKKHRQLSNIHRFAAGKGSALVIDVGQSMASVTPVVDGFVLRKGDNPALGGFCSNMNPEGLSYSPLPTFIHAHAHHILTSPTMHRGGVELIPHQLIANKIVCHNSQSFTFRCEQRIISPSNLWHRQDMPYVKTAFQAQQTAGECGPSEKKSKIGYKA